MKKIYLLMVAVVALLSGCISDDTTEATGNADITVTGIEKEYNIVSYSTTEHFKVSPVVTSTFDESDLEYSWGYYNTAESKSWTAKGVTLKPWVDTKDIDTEVTFPDGEYYVVFTVTSKSTGLSKSVATMLHASCDLSTGFVVFKENTEGNSDYDLYNPTKQTLMSDVIKGIQGQAIPGKPRHMDVSVDMAYMDETDTKTSANCLFFSTESDEVRWIRASDCATIMDASNAHFDPVAGEKPFRMARGYFENYYVTSSGVYGNYYGGYASIGIFGRYSGDGGSIHAVTNPDCYWGLVYWNDNTHSLGMADYNNGNVDAASQVDGYPAINTNYDCLHCGVSKTSNTINYFLLQNRSNPSEKVIYYVDCSMFQPIVTDVKVLDPNSHFARATKRAVNAQQAQIAYAVDGGKLYSFNLNTMEERELQLQGVGSGETITYIANRYYSAENGFDYLIVATQSGTTYHVYMYDMVGGEPVGAPKVSFSGTGIVRNLDYLDAQADADGYYMYVPTLDD